MRKIIIPVLFLSISLNADVWLPTFVTHPYQRELYGEQLYRTIDVLGTMYQLNYWVNGQLDKPALLQALNDVHAGKGKYTGVTQIGNREMDVYHASAGKYDATATLFFIKELDGNQRIIGMGMHLPVKINQPRVYQIMVWDERYTRIGEHQLVLE